MSDDVTAALARAGRFRTLAEQALADRPLGPEAALGVLRADDGEVADVLWAAFAVRARHFGRRVKLCILNNARSGLCPEDCGYCSQSAVATSDIPRYRLKSVTELVAAARHAAATGARRYCMVTSARGPSARDIEHVARAARAIRAELPDIELCASLGLMEDRAATALHDAGIDFVNHNLNTSRRFYPEICTTHTYDDRLATVQSVRRAGLRLCSGVIVGMGETDEDVLDVLRDLRDHRVDVVTIGQYLQPTERHLPLDRWVTPAEFAEYRRAGEALGFASVFAGPLVRSSYRADEQRLAARGESRAVAH